MKAKKTAGVKALVDEVLADLPAHEKGEGATGNVFRAIEANPAWLRRYHALCRELVEQWVVNNWIGKWTCDAVGGEAIGKVDAAGQTTLTKSYSKLRV